MDDFLTLVFFLLINFPIYLLLNSLFLANRDGSPLKIWQKVARAALAIFLIVSCRYFELMWLGMVLWLRPAGIGVELCCLVALITQKLLKKTWFSRKDRFLFAYGVYIGFIALTLAVPGIDFLYWKFLR